MLSLSLLVLRAADIEATLRFYRALGCVFVQEQHGSGPVHFSCDLQHYVLEIYPAKAGAPGESKAAGATMPGFTVDSLNSVLAALHTFGITLKASPKVSEWGRWVNITDPER